MCLGLNLLHRSQILTMGNFPTASPNFKNLIFLQFFTLSAKTNVLFLTFELDFQDEGRKNLLASYSLAYSTAQAVLFLSTPIAPNNECWLLRS